MSAPKKPGEEVLQIGAQIITLDAQLGQCLDKEEYGTMLDDENAAERINTRLKYIAESAKYKVGENDTTKPHKLLDILFGKFNDPKVGLPLRKVSFKKTSPENVSFEETSPENETMGGPKDRDWLTLVHAIGVTCGSKGEYPDFEGHSVRSWAKCYFKEHGGMPEYKDGMGVFPQ
ncbi:hypothetical protein NW767_015442 [Fusarium falciforme]|nr:hypothetical protein NW767_015442 [Fusarium falciforme]KAJ4181399.1 hypothetical protein NW759_017194 [Fusarium solani]